MRKIFLTAAVSLLLSITGKGEEMYLAKQWTFREGSGPEKNFQFGKNYEVDLDQVAGRTGKCYDECVIANQFELKKETKLGFGAGADYWFEAKLNGETIFSTFPQGNVGFLKFSHRNFQFCGMGKAGKNLLEIRVRRGVASWKFFLKEEAAEMIDPCSPLTVEADPAAQGKHIMNNVKDFGAVGDGVSKDTAAVQKAIDAGGMVYFPPGIYLCGTLYLKSHGGLHLDAGAVLLASPDKEDYNADDFCVQNSFSVKEQASGAHFIVALEQDNITIEGAGRIDGNRKAFYDVPEDWTKTWSGKIEWRPGQMIYFCECTNVRVRDVEMYHAPYWTCFFHGCENVQVSGVRIYNHPHTRNGDGLDIDCCRFVTVSDCIIDSGDDCITLRGNNRKLKTKRACEYVTITNCVLRTICNSFRIGVGAGIIRNAVISNCIIHNARMGITICSKYGAVPGTLVENIQFENLRINAELPISLLTNVRGKFEGPAPQPIRNISFHHIRGEGCSSIRVIGLSEGDIQDISFSDVLFDWTDGGNPSSEAKIFIESASAPCPDAAVYVACADRVTFDRFRIRWKAKNPNWKFGLRTERCSEVEQFRCDFGKANSIKQNPCPAENKLTVRNH